MRKLFWVGILAAIALTFFGRGYAQSDETFANPLSIDGTNQAWYSRPDLRDCVEPYCGGDWLYEPQPGKDPCLDELPLVGYVTGIYILDEEGRRHRIHPDCDFPLTGYFEPDPRYPDFDILIYLPYVP